MKKMVCVLLVVLLLLPTLAFAEKTYDSNKIFSGELNVDGVVFKAGDKFSSGRGTSVEVYYVDANDNQIEMGNGTIKSIIIDGERISEWAMTDRYGSFLQIGSRSSSILGFTLKPTYAVADSEGYFSIIEKTYNMYVQNAENKKVKFIGTVIDKDGDLLYLSIAENAYVAIKAETEYEIEDKLQCKGKIIDYIDYNGNPIPSIDCNEVTLHQYDPLQRGDKGPEVLEMKERMRTLGYFRANAELSDSYNDTCYERVQLFQQVNGLPATGEADVETLTLLFSDAAKPNN